MKRKFSKGCSLVLAASMIFSAMPMELSASITTKATTVQSSQLAENDGEYAKGEAIIMYQNVQSVLKSIESQTDVGSDIKLVETYDFDNKKSSGSAKSQVSGVNGFSVSLVKSDKYTTEELIEKLEDNKNIKYVEPNYRIKSLDTYSNQQWALDNKGQNGGIEGLDINADNEILTTDVDDEEKVIALVDTGIDYEHEDLKAVVWNNPINSKKLKGLHGYDFISEDEDPMDDNGHGTHCAGIMAGKSDNDAGISGVATSDNIKIMALKILDAEGLAYGMEAVGAYNYIYKAQTEGVNVVAVNNSWGALGGEESDILNELISMVGENGAVSVCAAGNDGGDNDTSYITPASYDNPYIISVAASNEKDELAAFSNYGATSVDIAAPGADILSTVNVDTFNPTIYEDKNSLCQIYEEFENKNIVQTIDDTGYNGETAGENEIAYGINTHGGYAENTVKVVEGTYFGENAEDESSLKWTIEGAQYGEIYALYLPYETIKSESALYSSAMVKVSGPKGAGEDLFGLDISTLIVTESTIDSEGVFQEDSEIYLGGSYVDEGNYWTHFSGSVAESVKGNQDRAIAIYLSPGEEGDYTINIDDFGVSAANVGSEKFGKYDFYNGTSMATPFVTGAVAAIANAYPDETPEQWKARILGSTRRSENLQEKVVTGGVLDLSKIDNPSMSVTSIENVDGELFVSGYYLDDAIVTINDEVVEPEEQNESLIMINVSDYANEYIYINIEKGEDVYRDGFFVASGEGFETQEGFEARYDGGALTSDGEKLYYINNLGNVYEGKPGSDKSLEWTDKETAYPLEMFGEGYSTVVDYEVTNESAVVSSNKSIWTVLKLDVGYSEETILATYNENDGWSGVAGLPDGVEDLAGYTLASYNGSIYILGGLDIATGKYSDKVYIFDRESEEWHEEASLPEGRGFSKAVQVDDKLVVTLGVVEDTEEFPKNIIFDGEEWKNTEATLDIVYNREYYEYEDSEGEYAEIEYYDAQIGIVEEGIIYTDTKVAGLGDTLIYNLDEDAYEPTDYALANSEIYGNMMFATTVRDYLYVLYGNKYVEEEYEYWDIGKKDIWDDLEDILSGEVEFEETCFVEVCRMPVNSGSIYVKDSSLAGATIKGAGYYLPGDSIEVSADIRNNYFAKSVTVDGQVVELNEDGKYVWSATADENGKVIEICANTGAYVSSITIPKVQEIEQGASVVLSAKVNPANAENTELLWTSDNASVVSVDNNGKITAASSAKEGTTVTIKAVAKDRGTVTASCVVTVKAKADNKNSEQTTTASDNKKEDKTSGVTAKDKELQPLKGKTYTVGQLKYKVVKNSGKNKTVTCVGAKNNNLTKVTIPAKVKINGYSFKVTEVAKNAFKNCKKLKKVTIGKNVTSIGKNAFRNCKKLSKVTVKAKNLKKVGKGSFYGSKKKVNFSFPAKQNKKYNHMIKKAMKE